MAEQDEGHPPTDLLGQDASQQRLLQLAASAGRILQQCLQLADGDPPLSDLALLTLERDLLRLRWEPSEQNDALCQDAERLVGNALLPNTYLFDGDVVMLLEAVLSTTVNDAGMLQPRQVTAALASTRVSLGYTLVHTAAFAGNVEQLQQLVAAAPQAANLADDNGRLPLHHAASGYCCEAVEVLLAVAPEAAAVADIEGNLPLHYAAHSEEEPADDDQEGCMQRLLVAAPHTALVPSSDGSLPLHRAALCGDAAVVQLGLEAAPAAVSMLDTYGRLPLHYAARGCDAAVVQLLYERAPHASRAADIHGCLPLHVAAGQGTSEAVTALLALDPGAAMVADSIGDLPLHISAQSGTVDAVPDLFAAAPEAAMVRDAGKLPLQLALQCFQSETRLAQLALLPHTGMHEAAAALAAAGEEAQPLFAALVEARPLGIDDWQLVPAPCRDLGAALPAVLARSAAEAAQLVRHLPRADRDRLQAAALWLPRFLPSDLRYCILRHVAA